MFWEGSPPCLAHLGAQHKKGAGNWGKTSISEGHSISIFWACPAIWVALWGHGKARCGAKATSSHR